MAPSDPTPENPKPNPMKPKFASARSLQLCAISFAFAGVSLLPTTALAGAIVWDGDTSTDFTDGQNWTGGVAPANDTTTDIATFNAATPNQPALPFGGDRSVNGLDFQTGGWTFGGADWTLLLGTGGITSTGNNTVQPNLNIAAGPMTFSSAAGGTLTVGSITTGGTLTLGTSVNTGTVVMQGIVDNPSLNPTLAFGTLIVNKGDGSPTGDFGSATNNLTVDAGATVKFGSNLTSRVAGGGRGQIYGTATVNGTMDLNGQGLTSAATNNWIMGALSGNGIVTNNGTGTAQIGVRGGTFTGQINNGTNATSLLVASGTFNWSGLGNFSGDIVTNGTLNFTGLMGGGTYAKTITGTGGLTFSAVGTQTLTGPNTYSGLTTIGTGATVQVGVGQASSLGASTGGLTMNGSSALDLNGQNLTKGNFSALAATATVTSATPATLTVNYQNTNNLYAGLSLINAASIMINGGASGTSQPFPASAVVNGTGSIGFQNQTGGTSFIRFNNLGANLGTNGDLKFNGGARMQCTTAQTFGAGTDILVNGLDNVWNWQNTTDFPGGGLKGAGDLRMTFGGGNKFMTLGGDNTTYTGTLTLDAATDRNARITLTSNSTIGLPLAKVVMIGNTNPTWVDTVLRYGGTASANVPLGSLSGTNPQTYLENNTAATTATWQIGGLNTNTTYPGTIRNGVGTTALEKVGTGTLTLSGAHSYTGATTVTAGTLEITGTLGSSPCNIASGATLMVANGTPSSITAGNNATFSMVDSTIGTVSVFDANVALGGASAGQKSLLKFEAGATTSDTITMWNNLTVDAGGVDITITPLGITAGQTYTLATFGSGSGAGFATGTGTTVGGITLTNPAISFGVNGTLQVTSGAIELVTTGSAAPANAYWSGSKGSTWNSNSGGEGNFTTTAAGGTFVSANPAITSNVFFSNNSPSNLSHTMGENFSVNGITYLTGSAAVSTTGTNQLTIGAGGITVQAGNGGATLGMADMVLAADQTWTNNSGNPLVVSANINEPTRNLLLAGSGTVTLGGAAKTFASLGVNSASLNLAGSSVTTGISSSTAAITNSGAAATLSLSTAAASATLSGVISGDIAIAKSGANDLTLSGSNTYTGLTAITGGSVILGNANALGTTAGITTLNGGTLELNGFSIAENIGSGNNTVIGSILNSSGTPVFVTGEVNGGTSDYTIGGSGDITFSRLTGNNGMDVTKTGTGTVRLVGSLDYANNRMIVNDGTLILDVDSNASVHPIGRGLTINAGATVILAGTGGDQITNTLVSNSGIFDMNDRTETIGYLEGASTGTITNTGSGSSTLTTTENTNTRTYAGNITDGTGTVAFVKGGSGTQILSGTLSHTGGTTINNGTLELGPTTDLADASTVSINGATSILKLTDGVTDVVASLVIDGDPKTGTWGATGSGAANIDDVHFVGTGKIQVGAAAAGYSTWAATHAPTGTAKDDYDNDGVANGAEYVLGGTKDTNDSGKLPTVASTGGNLVFSFKRDQASIDGTTVVTIDVGTTLASWPVSYVVGADTAGSSAGVTVVKDSPTAGTDTVTLTVTQAPDAKKFARLNVQVP